jgi:uncharacterized membrane protein
MSSEADAIGLEHVGITAADLQAQIERCRGDRRHALQELLEAVVCDERRSLSVRRAAAEHLIRLDEGAFSRRLWQQTVHMFELAALEAQGFVSASVAGGVPRCRSCQCAIGVRVETRGVGWHALVPPEECANLSVGQPCALALVGLSKVRGPATIAALDAQSGRRPESGRRG